VGKGKTNLIKAKEGLIGERIEDVVIRNLVVDSFKKVACPMFLA